MFGAQPHSVGLLLNGIWSVHICKHSFYFCGVQLSARLAHDMKITPWGRIDVDTTLSPRYVLTGYSIVISLCLQALGSLEWIVTLRDPVEGFQDNPWFVVTELLFIVFGILLLKHGRSSACTHHWTSVVWYYTYFIIQTAVTAGKPVDLTTLLQSYAFIKW